jgi:hypothetical protein
MYYELVSDDEYDSLPPEPEKRFAALVRICRRSMIEMISHETPQTYDSLLRTQYMTIVAAAAGELGIDGIKYISNFDSSQEEDLQEFIRQAAGVTAPISLASIRTRRMPRCYG